MTSNYIFRFPADAPDLDFGTLEQLLDAKCDQARCTSCELDIGSTVTVNRAPATAARAAAFDVLLYGTFIARVYADHVQFTAADDPHMATAEWIAKIIRDNAIGGGAARIRRHAGDGPGPETSRHNKDGSGHQRAGLLVIDWDRSRPVFGRSYPVGDIETRHQRIAEIRARITQARQQRIGA